MNFNILFEYFELIHWILGGTLVLTFLVQSYYYLGIYSSLPRYKEEKRRKSSKGISIIICARNEAENLEKFLPLVLQQNYPKYEVVVVNDCSSDRSEELLSEMKAAYPHLRYTSIPLNEKFGHGKKLALTIGLKAAEYEHVLLTDADCYPRSENWLQNMAGKLGEGKNIVLGYGSYEKQKGLLNILIRYETVFTAIQYLSFALKGRPYMGVGRNLAYRKDLFFKNKGFASHYHIQSGDDDLFVNQHATRENTALEIEAESFTVSLPEKSTGAWIRQKRRHLSAGKLYKKSSRIILGLELFSRILFYASFISLMLILNGFWPALVIFCLFQLIRMIILKMGMRRLKEKYLLLPSLLLDPVMPLILGAVWISNFFTTKNQSWR